MSLSMYLGKYVFDKLKKKKKKKHPRGILKIPQKGPEILSNFTKLINFYPPSETIRFLMISGEIELNYFA